MWVNFSSAKVSFFVDSTEEQRPHTASRGFFFCSAEGSPLNGNWQKANHKHSGSNTPLCQTNLRQRESCVNHQLIEVGVVEARDLTPL